MSETTVNEWDAERIAEARSVASGLAGVENTDAPVGKETFRFVAFFSGASVLSLLDALEEARHDAEEARTLAETLREDLRRMGRLHVERDNALALRRWR